MVPIGMLRTARMALMAAIIPLGIVGCTTTRGSFCDIAKPIRPQAEIIDQLSDQDVMQMLAHNEKLQRICGVKP